jgi:hypothetical protein
VKYHQEMLVAALHFFETSTNTFQFECGMMTPTLFDVAAITGLRPTGATYDPAQSSDNIKLSYKSNAYSKFISEHQKTDGDVDEQEHVAFLVLWLSQFVFCTRSLQVAKKFIPMAVQIHECQSFGLGSLILGALYEAMRSACENIKKTSSGSTFLGYGPFWLLQLWLNATFTKELDLTLPEIDFEDTRGRHVEGTRLARMIPRVRGLDSEHLFIQYFEAFLNLKTFKSSFSPFAGREVGPHWFVHPIPPLPEHEEEISEIWLAYLNPTLISCRYGLTSTEFGLVGYFPNLVSRQFGLTQLLPKSFYLNEQEICLGYYGLTEPTFHSFLHQTGTRRCGITPFQYDNSYLCTREFAKWWELHYSIHIVDKQVLMDRIRDGFNPSAVAIIQSKLASKGTF